MAAPPEASIRNLTGIGEWHPRIIRKAVSWATITGNLAQSTNNDSNTMITVVRIALGDIKGETEI
ncbi:hypothetical protein J3459_009964 [Metarhizium acridum]|nr:hypothetical protein J3459_009964 [Metarhizium acridum]